MTETDHGRTCTHIHNGGDFKMAPQLTNRQIAEKFARDGAFATIRGYVETGEISNETAAEWTARAFGFFLRKAREAQNEVRRIEAVLQRIVQISAAGSRPHRFQPRDPAVLRLAHEVTTFDNWVISLYETDLSMITFGAPERGKAKPLEMAKSMQALWEKRVAEANFDLSAPELFTRG